MGDVISEGKAKIKIVPGETKKSDQVFYNPHMKFNRDISTLALAVYSKEAKRKMLACDPFSASGVRGIRISLECPNIEKVIVNDLNPSAVKLIKANVKLNKVKNVEVESKDADVILSEHKHNLDYIDIDPFGTAAPHLDSMARAASWFSLVGVTDTGVAPLAGTYPKAARRTFFARPLHVAELHEIALRLLLAKMSIELAKYEKGFTPLISFAKRHYLRAMGSVKKGRHHSDKSLDQVGYLAYCRKCGQREYVKNPGFSECPDCGKERDYAGPLWTGTLCDKEFVKKMIKICEDESEKKFLEKLADESDISSIHYDTHDMSRKLATEYVPKTEDVIKALKKKGFKAHRSIYSGTAIRTDAETKDVVKAIKTA